MPRELHISPMGTRQVRDVKAPTEMAHTSRADVVSSNDPPAAAHDPLAAATAGTSQPNDIKYVVNEMVSYICHYRNSCSQAAMLKVVSGFYTPAEISGAKKCLLEQFHELCDTDFATERRSSMSRPASEAELEDILSLISLMDSSEKVNTVSFVAFNLNRLQGYGPEEINIRALNERQVKLSSTVEHLATEVKELGLQAQAQAVQQHADSCSIVQHTMVSIDKKMDDIRDKVSNLCCATCTPCISPSSQAKPSREQNIVVFGIPEANDWLKKLNEILNFVAGRVVAVQDAFKIGRADSGKTRSALVKLQNIWDRR